MSPYIFVLNTLFLIEDTLECSEKKGGLEGLCVRWRGGVCIEVVVVCVLGGGGGAQAHSLSSHIHYKRKDVFWEVS